MTSDILLSSGERETVGFLAVDVNGPTHDASGHLSEVGLCTSGDPVEHRPPPVTGLPKGCPSPTTMSASPPMARWLEHTEGGWLHVNDERSPCSHPILESEQALVQEAERVGLFDIDRTRTSQASMALKSRCPVSRWGSTRSSMPPPEV